MADIRVFSDDDMVTCEHCGGRCSIKDEPVGEDGDGAIFEANCSRCDKSFMIQFEDEEKREITGDGETEEELEGDTGA